MCFFKGHCTRHDGQRWQQETRRPQFRAAPVSHRNEPSTSERGSGRVQLLLQDFRGRQDRQTHGGKTATKTYLSLDGLYSRYWHLYVEVELRSTY